MSRILIITYFFPPDHVITHKRSYRIAKALAESGWEVDVLTTRIDDPKKIGVDWLIQDDLKDWQHLHNLPANVHVYRTPSALKYFHYIPLDEDKNHSKIIQKKTMLSRKFRSLMNKLLWPDQFVVWLPSALKKGLYLCKKNSYDVILSSSHPYTTHLIAYLIRWRKKLPWIVDLRDGWALEGNLQFFHIVKMNWQRKLNKWWMDHVLRQASSVWNLTPAINEAFIMHYTGRLNVKKFICIMLGADFSQSPEYPKNEEDTDDFILIYAGTFREADYPSDGFLKGLFFFRERFPDLAHHLRIEVYGRTFANDRSRKKVESYNMQDFFHFHPAVPEQRLLRLLMKSTCQLILGGDENWAKKRLSSKLFDYLITRRPILAITPDDSAIAQVVNETKTGWTIPPEQPEVIAEKLAQLLNIKLSQGKLNIDINQIALQQYSFYNTIVFRMLSEIQRITA